MNARSSSTPVNCKAKTPHLLVVEGKNDCHVITHLAAQNGLESSFGIWQGDNDAGAVDGFAGFLAASGSRPTILGIVVDCDSSEDGHRVASERRWTQIAKTLASYPYQFPPSPLQTGTILDQMGGHPRIGVWLMPDNKREGAIEDFLLQLVPPAAVAFARECAKAAKAQDFGDYKLVHESKAAAHTYLAWQDEPGRPLGSGVRQRSFDANSPAAHPFIQWLRDLFQHSILDPEEQTAQA